MSHWFHRNPIKATLPIDFDKRSFPSSSDAHTLCSLMKQSRANLLQLFSDPSTSVDAVNNEFNTYLSLLTGFVNDPSGRSASDSKLRYSFKAKWNESLGSTFTHEEQDAVFELSSIIINYGLWHSKHAAYVAAVVSEPSEKEAKEVHKSLKAAAGLFKYVQENLTNKLIRSDSNKFHPFADMTDGILSTYISQCKAEAQEITIARAIELKHSPGLICSIAQSTSILFQAAADSLATMDRAIIEKWSRYLALKSRFYRAQAYCYFGQDLLAQDKCGDAIKCMQESQKLYRETEQLCKEYANTKGPGTQAIPERHQFFRNLGTIIARITEKCERENGMIYHQKPPLECPVMETKAVHGLAEPEAFSMPAQHQLWTPTVYDAFNLSKGVDVKDKSASEKNIPAAKEVPIPQGNADPKTDSGCIVS